MKSKGLRPELGADILISIAVTDKSRISGNSVEKYVISVIETL